MRLPSCFGLLLLSCAIANAHAATQYQLRDLGHLGPGQTIPARLNAAQQVAGTLSGEDPQTSQYVSRPYFWDAGTFTSLVPPQFAQSSALDINAHGTVVGQAAGYVAGQFQSHGFVWQNGVMTTIPSSPGMQVTAFCINDAGWIGATEEAFGVWQVTPYVLRNGVRTNLPTLGGSRHAPVAMNAAGDMVGVSSLPGDTSGNAVLWRNDVLIDLGRLGGYWAQGSDINDAGVVVGQTDSTILDPWGYPTMTSFVWRNGTMQDLGGLGGSSSAARAINAHDQIVGLSNVPGDMKLHGYLHEQGQMIDLNSVIDASLGYEIWGAYDINDDGVIVAYASYPGAAPYEFHTVLLIPQSGNTPPGLGTVVGPQDPKARGSVVAMQVDFVDPDAGDQHVATWNWGDGSTTGGSVSESSGTGSATGSHVYAAAGVYTVQVTITDAQGASASASFEYVVIYDAAAGFVTGSGAILSPPGALPANPSATGRATFGFVSRYLHGATTPSGNTEFRFKNGNFLFRAARYDWMVIAGSRVQYKGAGEINGQTGYEFTLTAIDASDRGSGASDTFRIRIRDAETHELMYDNQPGANENADPASQLESGQIVIHR